VAVLDLVRIPSRDSDLADTEMSQDYPLGEYPDTASMVNVIHAIDRLSDTALTTLRKVQAENDELRRENRLLRRQLRGGW
jgi:hypothetical protein